MSYERRVLFVDGLAPEGRALLEKHPDLFKFEIFDSLSKKELLEKISEVEVLAVRTKTNVDLEILKAGKNLKLVGRAGTGVDHIDCVSAKELGIAVMNTSAANSVSTAELAVGLLLSAARQIPLAHQNLKEGEWKPQLGMELHRKTLGIIGLGRIGRLVTSRLHAFGMKVVATDPYKTQKDADELGVRLLPLDELLAKSDVVSLHCPLTEETRGMISKAKLDILKPGAVLVNVARGDIVVESDILDALDSRHLRAYAADVFQNEPLPKNHRFLKHPSIMLTPHMGAQTAEAQRKVNLSIAIQIIHYCQTGEIEHQIV